VLQKVAERALDMQTARASCELRGGGRPRQIDIMTKLTILILCSACVLDAACEKAPAPPVVKAAEAPAATAAATASAVAQQASQTPTAVQFDACSLLTKEEVGEVAGSPIKDTKSNQRPSEAMTTAQCFYTAEEFSRSINLTVMLRNPGAGGGRAPKDVWRDSFAKFSNGENREREERERERAEGDRTKGSGRESEEREKESKPPMRVDGVGEEAFWTSGIGGTLYVLKGDLFLRLSIGGPSKDEEKLNQAKVLAAKALERL
jgi:hypothetical protein